MFTFHFINVLQFCYKYKPELNLELSHCMYDSFQESQCISPTHDQTFIDLDIIKFLEDGIL